MLANGTLLGFRPKGSPEIFTDLPDLKELPDIDDKPERIENTPINATSKRYEMGVGDMGEMAYTFCYNGADDPGSAICLLQDANAAGEELEFQETWTDGVLIQYTAVPHLSFTRGTGLNGIILLKVTMFITSDIETILPTKGGN